jgi:hypothetical protein
MYEFKPDPEVFYSEAPQDNPLRWQLLYREGDVFTPQTKQFRCKDYLNDVASKYAGTEVIAYGMNTNIMTLNPEGTWLRLFNIYDKEVFMANINTCINKENPEYPLTMEAVDDTILMFVPRYYYNQTYLISLVTYVIRISNRKTKFRSFTSAMSGKDAEQDRAIQGRGIKLALSWGYKVPEDYQKYVTYYKKDFNSLVGSYTGSTIHNCGVMAWCSDMAI